MRQEIFNRASQASANTYNTKFKVVFSPEEMYNQFLPIYYIELLQQKMNSFSSLKYGIGPAVSISSNKSEKSTHSDESFNKHTDNNKDGPKLKFFKVEKLPENQSVKMFKKGRKFNKDCILKKIKSRFFKYYINSKVEAFIKFLNNNTNIFQKKLDFKRLNEFFIKDVTIKRNVEWDFINKSVLELFLNYSDMAQSLKDFYELYVNNKDLVLDELLKDLDPEIKIIMFQSFKNSYVYIMKNKRNMDYFINNVMKDFIKEGMSDNEKEKYYFLFKTNIQNFISYFKPSTCTYTTHS